MKREVKDLLSALMEREPGLRAGRNSIEQAFALLEACYLHGGKVLVCGNGGSAADSEHIVGELMKGFDSPRPIPTRDRVLLQAAFPKEGTNLADALQGALPAISLVSQVSLCSAVLNDVSAQMIFAQQVYGYGRKGDVLIGISTSGNASNVIQALRVARAFGLKTIGFTGEKGGSLKELCTVLIAAPLSATAEIQEIHQRIYHTLCAMLERRFFGEGERQG